MKLTRLVSLKVAASALALSLAANAEVRAQGQTCGVGTRVEFDDGARGVGTIEEIGTASPHVGWYRISFSWNPKGDWYSPASWGILVAGTKTKCQAAAPPARAASTPPTSTGGPLSPSPTGARRDNPLDQTRVAGLPEAGTCPMVEPPGKTTDWLPSAQLFKRVIYERAAAKINPGSISAPTKVGLTFLVFDMDLPFKNTLTSSRFGDKRRHDGAPEGVMVYPIKTRELQCDLHGSTIRRSVSEVSRHCFTARSGEWTCPGRTTKFIENTSIPVG